MTTFWTLWWLTLVMWSATYLPAWQAIACDPVFPENAPIEPVTWREKGKIMSAKTIVERPAWDTLTVSIGSYKATINLDIETATMVCEIAFRCEMRWKQPLFSFQRLYSILYDRIFRWWDLKNGTSIQAPESFRIAHRKKHIRILGCMIYPTIKEWIEAANPDFIRAQRTIFSIYGPTVYHWPADLEPNVSKMVLATVPFFAGPLFPDGEHESFTEYFTKRASRAFMHSQIPCGISLGTVAGIFSNAKMLKAPLRPWKEEWHLVRTALTHRRYGRHGAEVYQVALRSTKEQYKWAFRYVASRALRLHRYPRNQNELNAVCAILCDYFGVVPRNCTIRRLAELTVEQHLEEAAERHAVEGQRLAELEAITWEDPLKISDQRLTHLNTGRALLEVGNAMNHCVAHYVYACKNGHSSIYHYEDQYGPATIEVHVGSRRVNQSFGPGNKLTKAAENASKLVNKLLLLQ